MNPTLFVLLGVKRAIKAMNVRLKIGMIDEFYISLKALK